MLGWYVPGISELPLGHRLQPLLPGESLIYVSLLSCFNISLVCAWVYPEHDTAGKPGAVAGVSGGWRVEEELDGARSPFSWLGVACPLRHKRSMNRLRLTICSEVGHNMYQSIRVVLVCKIKSKMGLFLRPS